VLADINIIIPQGTRPEEHMHVQGQKEFQVCLISGIEGGGMGQISSKGRIETSSHHHLMETIGEEKMQNRGLWE
jgi:hypothetical protein